MTHDAHSNNMLKNTSSLVSLCFGSKRPTCFGGFKRHLLFVFAACFLAADFGCQMQSGTLLLAGHSCKMTLEDPSLFTLNTKRERHPGA